jgi:hypothetical protein
MKNGKRRRIGGGPLSILAISLWLCLVMWPSAVQAQGITLLIVDIKTADVRFAGTDDPIQLQIGGQTFMLDNPNHDDFERNNTDRFMLQVPGGRLTRELIRAVGEISITKLDDSFWGGGWNFKGITIWAESDATDPLFQKGNVDKWLDGDDLQWRTTLDEDGWNVPEPPPFPPCLSGDVDGGLQKDSDCDGIPDGSDPTVDNPPDADGDGMPDLYETQTGSNPNNPDSDGDGWWDGRNRRSILLLTRIRCLDENEDIGVDEIYVVSEEVRFPVAQSLSAYWPMNDSTETFPGLIVDSRVSPPAAVAGAPLSFKTRLRLREADPAVFEKPTDDTYKVFEITWGENGIFTVEHDGDDAHYILEFKSVTMTFADPVKLDANADNDHDALNDRKEFQIAVQDPAVQPAVIEGYNGLSDPEWRDLFLEIDAVGADETVPYDAKQMAVSQFYVQGITLRIDAALSESELGHLGGGDVLDYEETLTMAKLTGTYRPAHFANGRSGHFRYALFVDNVIGEGCYGEGNFPPGKNFIVAHFRLFCAAPDLGHTMIAEYAPILILHEMGHTLGFCHRDGDKGKQACGSCPTPAGWEPQCDHYCGVGQNSVTAMGSDTLFDLITEYLIDPWTLAGIGAGIVIGGLIGGIPGAIIGGILGGLIGGLLGGLFGGSEMDAFRRFVDYDPAEWAAIQF